MKKIFLITLVTLALHLHPQLLFSQSRDFDNGGADMTFGNATAKEVAEAQDLIFDNYARTPIMVASCFTPWGAVNRLFGWLFVADCFDTLHGDPTAPPPPPPIQNPTVETAIAIVEEVVPHIPAGMEGGTVIISLTTPLPNGGTRIIIADGSITIPGNGGGR